MLKNIIKNKLYKSGIPYQIIGEGTPFNEEKIRLIILSLKYLVNEDLKYLTEISKILKIKDVVISEKLRTLRKTSDLNQIIAGLLNFFNIHCNQTESLQEFINSSLPYSKSANGLTDFVEYIKYLEDHEFYDARADKVTLLTIHAAKGLEFSHVYLIGFNEDIMPLIDAHFENVEEEKRLCYVAMTRAKDTLTLITTVKRFGNKKNISPFSILLESQVEKITDPEINKIKKKIEKRKIKQVSLFDP
jgi:superfamily I DNA/RNA helicase